MQLIKWVGVLCVVVAISGCVTSYKPEGFSGGFREQQIANDTFIVSAHGNAFASMDLVQTISLRRAAELSVQNGFSYFVVMNGSQDYQTGVITTPGTYTGTTTGSAHSLGGSVYGQANTYGTYTPGMTNSYSKPSNSITVKMFEEAPFDMTGIHNAAEVLRYTSNLVQ